MKERFSWLCNAGGVIFTAIQTDVIFQTISLILTCIATLLSISITIYNLVKKAREGKFEAQDLEEAKKQIEALQNQIKEMQEESNE